MMAENADINMIDTDRQSKDYPDNFNAENPAVPIREASILDDTVSSKNTSMTENSTLDDSRFKCWCHEVLIPNQRPERCSPGWDETPSDKSSERDSISSFKSIDSGYDSIKRTHVLHL